MNLIERWAQSQDLGPVSNPRRFAVNIDQARIHLLELHPGQCVIESRICELPVAPGQQEKMLLRALHISLARARDSASQLVVDDDASSFWLQRRLQPGAGLEELDSNIEELVNDIELWRTAL